MRIEFSIGTKHKAVAFYAKFNCGRQNPQTEAVGLAVVKSMNHSLAVAREEMGYSNKRMETADVAAKKNPLFVYLDLLPAKDGGVNAMVEFPEERNEQQEAGPVAWKNARDFATAVYDYLRQYRKDATNGERPSWMRKIYVNKKGF